MLILSRKTGQSVHVGDNVTITVLKVRGNSVRIGIEAPNDVRVLRAELPERQPGNAEDDSPQDRRKTPQTTDAETVSDDGKAASHPPRHSADTLSGNTGVDTSAAQQQVVFFTVDVPLSPTADCSRAGRLP